MSQRQFIFGRYFSEDFPHPGHIAVIHTVNCIMNPLLQAKDERSLVIVGALILENEINRLLSAIMPGYKHLEEGREFSFSFSINLAEALQLIPQNHLKFVDFARILRNEFAHDIRVDKFTEMDAKKLNRFRQHYKSSYKGGYTDSDVYVMLVRETATAIYFFSYMFQILNDFLHSDELLPALKQFRKKGRK